jgi:AraC-like DNA-binding protein
MVVGQIFRNAGIDDADVQMGKVIVKSDVKEKQLEGIEKDLNWAGFEIIKSHTLQLVEQIKAFAINYVHKNTSDKKQKFSLLLSSEMNLDYNYLSSLFSSVENTTIEHYLIGLRIERVKELLVYDEKTLSEIAWEVGYSSVAHLSGQFKKVTGFTPSYFKKLREQKRKSIDNI